MYHCVIKPYVVVMIMGIIIGNMNIIIIYILSVSVIMLGTL